VNLIFADEMSRSAAIIQGGFMLPGIKWPVVLVGVLLIHFFSTSPSQTIAQTGSPAIKVGEPFPETVFPALEDGSPMSIRSFRGKKVLLHVFASW